MNMSKQLNRTYIVHNVDDIGLYTLLPTSSSALSANKLLVVWIGVGRKDYREVINCHLNSFSCLQTVQEGESNCSLVILVSDLWTPDSREACLPGVCDSYSPLQLEVDGDHFSLSNI